MDQHVAPVETAVVMAAGRGTRMKELTNELPKALIPVHGKPFIIYLLERIRAAGFTRVILVTGYKQEHFESAVGHFPNGIEIILVNQFERLGEEQYGTAMALKAAEPELNTSPFVTLAGDQLYAQQDLLKIRKYPGFTHLVGAKESSHPQDFGVLVLDHEGRVQQILEKPESPPSNLVNVSFYRFQPDFFDALHHVERSPRGEYEITDAVNILAKTGNVFVFRMAEPTLHITNPNDVSAAHEFVQKV